ncbi:hypothetical protein Ocin01_04392 [Orchesella cincta]|uniref:Uncharacterized protein n=1 Tax=Orchesella cincta TaxID=48709 RepID=A0A1D2NBA6_ORCCI|nr:hypothetical protein Ocin01_04392 [Orchesella cincta]
MDWHEFRKILAYRILILGVLVGSSLSAPLSDPADLNESVLESSATTAEIFRNVQKLFSLAKPIGRQKLQKQDEGTGVEGSANALATITDSFGGQLAGQIISVILSSVTGDVRGILGNSLNLFQTDDTRDRVQTFLDEISQNFLRFTGLNQLTSTMSPQLSTLRPILLGTANGGAQVHQYQPAQIVPVSPGGAGGGLRSPSSAGLGALSIAGSGLAGNVGQQQNAAGQPIIYVLPSLNSGNTNGGSTATKPNAGTGNKRVTTQAASEDDSEEDRERSLS